MTYQEERVERWAEKIYEATKPVGAAPWASIQHGPAGDRWRKVASAAVKVHLECCERRCAKCNSVFVHFCSHCDRQ